MFAFVGENKREQVGAAIEKAGGVWMKVRTGAEGVRLEV
jgi:hypothetical protein